ncbi:mutS protein homolog 5-like [Cydia splendana]|uniref:mutS protein homolog 5-like n=1 Tax=Cydia splendana TaxID=1100963 RepID=UPI00300CE909
MINGSSNDASTNAPRISSSETNQRDPFVISRCRRNNEVTVNNDDTNNDSTEETDVEEKLLTIYCRAGKLGAAYYTIQTGELHILEELPDRAPEFLMFRNLFRQVEPLQVLLDGRTQSAFVSAVKKTVFADGEGGGKCKLVFLASKEYSFEACKRRIYLLSLPTEPKNCTDEERTLFLRTVIDFNQTQTVHALGALLKYLDLNWSNLNLDLQSKPQFLSLRRISLKDIVTIDEDTYRGLQIFSTISHPSNFKKGVQGSNKEGLSLFYIFSKCSSKVGQKMMRVLMQHPTTNLETIKRRQDAVEFFMKPQSDTIMRNMCSSLRFIKNVNGILTKIKELSAKPYQWKSLYNTLYNAVLICEMCENVGKYSEFLEQLAAFDNNKLYEMALYMNRIIDFDLSKTERKFTVKAGVDQELDMKKQTMASLHTLMSETAKVELERLPLFVEECTMLYMPHLGYLLGVKIWAEGLTMEEKQLPDMKFMFQNNDYIHYKSKGCEELDVMIGDTYPEIVAHETRIKLRLTAVILDNLNTLAACVDACAELDCLIAIAKVSIEYNFVRPTMSPEKIIDIKDGRHPLHILTTDNFVPNDAQTSAGACARILTGPNASGKSVYMKMIGLIVYLAHIGSFVPARTATIGIIRHIRSRLQTAECVATHMSAFLIDLKQMELALQESTSDSLILIDEFGKGTSEVDGLSLLAACLNTFLFQGDACPHIFLSTHFLNIREYIVETPLVKFLRFEHVMDGDAPVFLFRVTEGCVDSSFALQVARASGVDGGVLDRASEVADSMKYEGILIVRFENVMDGDAPVFLFRVTEGCVDSSFALRVARASGVDGGVLDRASEVADSMKNNCLPPQNKKITTKLKAFTEIIKSDLAEDI